MNIEEAIKILKQEPDFSLNYYNRENAIDVLLTAYEKEKEKNRELEIKNKELNVVRLTYLVEVFPNTTETHIKYMQELRELLKELEE